MYRVRPALFLLSLLVCAYACGPTTGRVAGRGNSNVLSTAEIDASGYSDVLSLVQAVRPSWLRTRGVSSLSSPEVVRVYLDGSLLGGPDHLRQITTGSISTIRYLDGLEATQRWGLDHGAGAIMVTTRGRTD